MKEDLRKYNKDHPSEKDIYSEDYDLLWEGINSKLDRHQQKERRKWVLRIAASILIIVAAGLVFFGPDQERGQVAEIIETESYYTEMIDAKMELIQSNRNRIDPVILEDLQALDQAMQELKEDLQDQAHNEEVIQAMVTNYKVKLEILEQILEQLNESENGETSI